MKKLAILAILALFSVLLFGCINPPTMPTSPNDAASDLIKNQINRPSEYVQSQVVVFDAQNSTLSSKVISINSKTGIAQEQICIGTGDFAGNSNFNFAGLSSGSGVMLTYNGSGSQRASIGAICDDGQSIMNDLQDLQIQIGDMQCGDGGYLPAETPQTYCILILKSA